MMKRRVFLAGLICLPRVVLAHSYRAGDIAIGHAWALPSRQNDGQVFMPLLNGGKVDDALVAARSEVAGLVEFRKNNRYDDPPLEQFVLPAGRPLPMRPTAFHLRLVGLSKPLVTGDRFKMVLDFLNAGEVAIEVHVQDKAGD